MNQSKINKGLRRKPSSAPAPKNRLRELREKTGWTVEDVGGFIGIDKSHVSLLETGKRRLTEETIEKFATLYRVKPREIFHLVFENGEVADPFARRSKASED